MIDLTNINNPFDLPRVQQVLLFTFGALEKLVKDGFLEGPKALTEKGREMFRILDDSGFRPTSEELAEAINAIQSR